MWLYVLCSLVVRSGLAERVHDNSTTVGKEATLRIKGGHRVSIERYPFTVQYDVGNDGFCGGAIVSMKHILTAAHCVDRASPDSILLKAGNAELDEGTVIPIADILLHPDYNRRFAFDIAILTTMERISFSDRINRVRIAPEDQEEFDHVFVAGWGEQRDPELSDDLNVVNAPRASTEECRRQFGGLVSENTFCTEFARQRKGPCKGDDGGPAIFSGTLVGLVSVPGICRFAANVPSLYTALAGPEIHSFIVDNTYGTEEGPGM